MSAPNRPTAARRRPVPLRRAAALVVVAAVATVLSGCGLRLETPPPAEPSPDAVEQVRGRPAERHGTAAGGGRVVRCAHRR